MAATTKKVEHEGITEKIKQEVKHLEGEAEAVAEKIKQEVKKELKHLEFVKIAVHNFLLWLWGLYLMAKQFWLLKSGLGALEGTVSTVVGPVLDKFKDVPHNLLKLADDKVDAATKKFDQLAPAVAKQAASAVTSGVKMAAELTQGVVSEAKTKGVVAAASFAVKKSGEETVKAVTSLLPKLVPVDKVAEAVKKGGEVAKQETQQLSKVGETVASEIASVGGTVAGGITSVGDAVAKGITGGITGGISSLSHFGF